MRNFSYMWWRDEQTKSTVKFRASVSVAIIVAQVNRVHLGGDSRFKGAIITDWSFLERWNFLPWQFSLHVRCQGLLTQLVAIEFFGGFLYFLVLLFNRTNSRFFELWNVRTLQGMCRSDSGHMPLHSAPLSPKYANHLLRNIKAAHVSIYTARTYTKKNLVDPFTLLYGMFLPKEWAKFDGQAVGAENLCFYRPCA